MRRILLVHTLACIILPAVFLTLSGCSPQQNTAVGYYFDTVVTLSGYCPEEVLQDALAECGRYEELLSRFREESDVWRLNTAGGAPVSVSEDTLAILQVALDVGEKSGGAFDITVAPAMDLWDFLADSPTLPEPAALEEAVTHIDYRGINIDGSWVSLQPGQQIDLGGVAKGYVADCILDYLAERGASRAIINIGGNVKTLGEKSLNESWRIGIQDPTGNPGDYFAVLPITGGETLVTSGTYERGFDLGGVRYHHILDPETGYPVQNGLCAVTILSDSSLLADALSTACFVLGPERGMELAEEYGASALFVLNSGKIIASNEMEARIELE